MKIVHKGSRTAWLFAAVACFAGASGSAWGLGTATVDITADLKTLVSSNPTQTSFDFPLTSPGTTYTFKPQTDLLGLLTSSITINFYPQSAVTVADREGYILQLDGGGLFRNISVGGSINISAHDLVLESIGQKVDCPSITLERVHIRGGDFGGSTTNMNNFILRACWMDGGNITSGGTGNDTMLGGSGTVAAIALAYRVSCAKTKPGVTVWSTCLSLS